MEPEVEGWRQTVTDLQDWTSCQVHGHVFEDGWCTGCGEEEDLNSDDHRHSFGPDGWCRCGDHASARPQPRKSASGPGEHAHKFEDGWCECGEPQDADSALEAAIAAANDGVLTELEAVDVLLHDGVAPQLTAAAIGVLTAAGWPEMAIQLARGQLLRATVPAAVVTEGPLDPDKTGPWPSGTFLRLGDEVASFETFRSGTVVAVYQKDGTQRIAVQHGSKTAPEWDINPAGFAISTEPVILSVHWKPEFRKYKDQPVARYTFSTTAEVRQFRADYAGCFISIRVVR